MLFAAVLPAPVSAKLFTLFCKILASGFASLTPARYPYPNSFITSVAIPITIPVVFVFVVLPAIYPTRYDACACSNIRHATLSSSIDASSTIANFLSGFASASVLRASANWYPIQIIRS